MPKLHDQPYVLSSFLTGFPELIASLGGSTADVCARAGVEPSAMAGPHYLLPFDQFVELLEVAAVDLRCPDFALDLAAHQDLRPMGPLTGMFTQARTVEEALETISHQLSLLVSGIHIRLIKQRHIAALDFDVSLPELAPRKQFQDYLLASAVNTVRQLCRDRYPLRGAYFTRVAAPKEDVSAYGHYFRSPVAFGADAMRLTYDAGILPGDVKRADPGPPNPRALDGAGLRKRVTDALVGAMPSGDIALSAIAKSLGCSERTLRRHLADQGLSFTALRDGLRYAMANEYLQSTLYSVADIATLLGYRNQSAFTRSYLRWSGITPRAFRASLRSSVRL